MTAWMVAAMSILGVAAALTLTRIARGPRMLDRVIAADVLVAIVIAGLGIEAAVNRHTTTLPILVVLSLVGFVGSVSIARFAAREQDGPLAQPPPRRTSARTSGKQRRSR